MTVVVSGHTVVSVVIAILVAFAIFALFRDAASIMVPLGVGVALALALDGVVCKIAARTGWSRSIAVSIVALALFVIGVAVVVLLGPPAVRQAQQFATALPQTVQDLYDLPIVGGWLRDADAVQVIQDFIAALPARITSDSLASAANSLIGGVATMVIIVLTTFSVLIDGERLVGLVRQAIPVNGRERADAIGRIVYRVIGKYFAGSLTVSVMMGIYVLTIALVFGVPLAPLVAIWAMVTNLIPQVGGFLGGLLLGVVSLAAGPGTAIIVIALFVVYMTFDNHVIQPAVIGKAVDLSPPSTMMAAFIGAAAAGIPGALLATPIFGAAKQLYFEVRTPGSVNLDEPSGLRARLRQLRRREPH